MSFLKTLTQRAFAGRRAFSTMAQLNLNNNLASTYLLFNTQVQASTTPISEPFNNANLIEQLDNISLELMNRNKRKLKKANHGARPCNSRGRKARRMRRHLYA